jgi:glyoxylase-like metal-dependent hydrolase (beta-lactamase superfamily II)
MPSRVTRIALALAASGVLACGTKPARAQQTGARAAQVADTAPIQILHVQGNIYMLAGDGGNITAQVGEDGVLLVNTGRAALIDKLLAAVKTLSDQPIRYLINTDDDPDNVLGNEAAAKVGKTIAGGNVVGNIGESASSTATVVAFQTVLDRMSAPTGKQAAAPEGAWPTDTYTLDHKDLFFNNEGIRVFHQPAAHTDGDSVVFFRRSDVISVGDIFSTTTYPVIDLQRGGSIQGVVDGLNRLVRLVIPGAIQGGPTNEGGTMIVPSHGRICDEGDLAFYQEMITVIRDRVQDMIKKGMTLQQVKAARPTLDYDPRYGKDNGPWTTDMFVEAVYRSLSEKKH